MIRIIILCVFIIGGSACCRSPSSVMQKKYLTKGDRSPESFKFYNDSIFIYNLWESTYEYSIGRFSQNKKMIILNSDIQRVMTPINVVTTPNDSLKNRNRVIISSIKAKQINEHYLCIPILNQDTLDVEDWGKYSLLYSKGIDSIQFQIWLSPFAKLGRQPRSPIYSEIVYFKNLIGHNINIEVNIVDSLFGYKVISNKEIEIKRNKILLRKNGNLRSLYQTSKEF